MRTTIDGLISECMALVMLTTSRKGRTSSVRTPKTLDEKHMCSCEMKRRPCIRMVRCVRVRVGVSERQRQCQGGQGQSTGTLGKECLQRTREVLERHLLLREAKGALQELGLLPLLLPPLLLLAQPLLLPMLRRSGHAHSCELHGDTNQPVLRVWPRGFGAAGVWGRKEGRKQGIEETRTWQGEIDRN